MRIIIAIFFSISLHILLLGLFLTDRFEEREKDEFRRIYNVDILRDISEKNIESSIENIADSKLYYRKKIKIKGRTITNNKNTNDSNITKSSTITNSIEGAQLKEDINRKIPYGSPVQEDKNSTYNNGISMQNISTNNEHILSNENNQTNINYLLEEIYNRLNRAAKKSYPYKAKRLGIEGKVLISFKISKSKKPQGRRYLIQPQ